MLLVRFGLAVLQSNCDMTNEEGVAQCAIAASVEQVSASAGHLIETRTLLNGIDVTDDLRQEHLGEAASIIGQYPAVRKRLLSVQELHGLAILAHGRHVGLVGEEAHHALVLRPPQGRPE